MKILLTFLTLLSYLVTISNAFGNNLKITHSFNDISKKSISFLISSVVLLNNPVVSLAQVGEGKLIILFILYYCHKLKKVLKVIYQMDQWRSVNC
jgi:hypothetical protein